MVPVIEYPYGDLAEVQAVGVSPLTRGIGFRAASDGRWAIFWTSERDEVLDQLERLGVLTERVPIRLNVFRRSGRRPPG
jgi:hypothetical protein